MGKTVAYIRASTDKQDIDNQRLQILDYGNANDISVDDFINITISSRKTKKQRRIDELMEKLNGSDTLIVTELSRLGRSTAEVITLINELVQRQIRVIIIKQNLDIRAGEKDPDMSTKIIITLFSLFAELERDIISLRTKDALAAKKKQGMQLGKPKGTIQASKYDKHQKTIISLLRDGVSVRKIAKNHLYCDHSNLNSYIKKRKLREIAVGEEVK